MGAYYSKGVYVGRVVSQALGVSSKKQTPQFTVTCEIIDALDQFGASLGVTENYQRTVYLYLTEKAMDMTLSALAVLGFNKSSLKYLNPDTPGFVDFAGVEVELYCNHEQYEGDEREKWSINTPREKKEVAPVDPSALRKLDALFGKGLKQLAAGEKPVPKTDPNDELQDIDNQTVPPDDEIPF